MRRREAGTLSRTDRGSRVRLQGWVARRRDLGALVFLQLRDRSGVAQAVVHPAEHPEAAEVLHSVRLEWVIEVEGEVVLRRPEEVNPAMATGEVEVVVERAAVLAEAEPLPFTLDDKAEASEETRLRYRYLDLRRPALQGNLLLRHRATYECRRYLDEQGFVEVETPILTLSTPEGARDYLVPSRERAGSFYALPQSPQLFKQILMVSGFERYMQIARCFRDEDLRADRQPEFTQIDLEMSFVEEADVLDVVEGLLARVFPLVGIEPEPPFPRLTWAEAKARYGSDRPDLRFSLQIRELSDIVADSGFRVFRRTVAEGGVVRGFAVPGAAPATRRQVDGWAALAQEHGSAGVLTLRRQDGELRFQVKGALEVGEMTALAEPLGLEDGGLALLVAGPEPAVAESLGALRVELARAYDLIPAHRHAFTWVTEFPLLEWSGEEERWVSTHHPFTAPDPRDLDRLESAPGEVRSRAYDVVMDGVELGGGSIRIHRRDVQERVFRRLGIAPQEAEARFGFLLRALSFGAPPHGGIALGLDRIVALMAGASSIREVIAFPKTTSATCLMTGAPASVNARQLEELGLEPTRRSRRD